AARQYFHDLNVLAVRPNTSLGLSMDTRDPFITLLDDVETSIDFLRGRVDKQARQLRKSSDKVLTMQTLRQMVINIAKGISDIQSVDWKKGQRWSGIAGRVNEQGGNFIVGGTKEVAYAVFNVLANPDNDGFRRVRGTPSGLTA